MWVSKISEIIGSSPTSFEDAAQTVLSRANHTPRGITEIEVVDKRIKIENDQIAEYRRTSDQRPSKPEEQWQLLLPAMSPTWSQAVRRAIPSRTDALVTPDRGALLA